MSSYFWIKNVKKKNIYSEGENVAVHIQSVLLALHKVKDVGVVMIL